MKEILLNLEKQVDAEGTFYMVWETRKNDDMNVDIYFSEKVTQKEMLEMIDYLTHAVNTKFKK